MNDFFKQINNNLHFCCTKIIIFQYWIEAKILLNIWVLYEYNPQIFTCSDFIYITWIEKILQN